MRTIRNLFLLSLVSLFVLPIADKCALGQTQIITVRTGQVSAGVPGSCTTLDTDMLFHCVSNTACDSPYPGHGAGGVFDATDFNNACAGTAAVLAGSHSQWGSNRLAHDLQARWIHRAPAGCVNADGSGLYCAPFNVTVPCPLADSIRIYWSVDNRLGDTPGAGANPDGIYINGTSLGSVFRGTGADREYTGVVYNVPINTGVNNLATYVRDTSCGDAGFILSCTVYVSSHASITIRTGQVSPGVPGACTTNDADMLFHYVSNTDCNSPYPGHGAGGVFNTTDFTNACAGTAAVLAGSHSQWGSNRLAHDLQARWIHRAPAGCVNADGSGLYCAPFTVTCPPCPMADSIRIYWSVDNRLGDSPGAGANPDGIYLNGTSLGAVFRGTGADREYTGVAYNVPINTGVNNLAIYVRDTSCGDAGFILSCTIYMSSSGGSIAGHKWQDDNCNGVWDGGETALPNWRISLVGPVSRDIQTDGSGNFAFTNLPFGHYTIHEVTQPDWVLCGPSGTTGGRYSVTVDQNHCGSEGYDFGNSLCTRTPYCWDPPACLQSWYRLDEGTGATGVDAAAGRNLTFLPSSAWTADPCGSGRFSADLTSATPLRYLEAVGAGNSTQHNFADQSFAIFGWVYMNNPSDGLTHTLVDKREQSPNPVNPKGYVLYVYNGSVYLQLSHGGTSGFRTYTGPTIPAHTWCFVGVNACRTPGTPSGNTATLYVNTTRTTYTNTSSPAVDPGNLTNAANLRVGEQCPPWTLGVPLGGMVDNLQIYRCCLTDQQIADLYNHHCVPCDWSIYAPSISTNYALMSSTAGIYFKICNYSNRTCTFNWTIAGLPLPAPPYTISGPTVYSSYAGSVTIAPYPACQNISVDATVPPGMSFSDLAGYQITVKNMCTGDCKHAEGAIRKATYPVIGWPGSSLVLQETAPGPGGFVVRNDSDSPVSLPWRVSSRSADGDPGNQVVRLNGLPPGEPVLGTLNLASGDSGSVNLAIALTQTQCLNINEVVFEADWDGTGHYTPVEVLSLESVSSGQSTSSVNPGTSPAEVDASATSWMSVAPNPFVGGTEIRFYLGSNEASVRVGVFDVGGRLIRNLHAGSLSAGDHRVAWDGRSASGQKVSAGIYFVRVQASGSVLKSMVVRME